MSESGEPPGTDPLETLYARGVTDGLPVVPPTTARVAAAVEASGRPRDELIALVAPRLGRATVERVAINAVMAGGPPQGTPAGVSGRRGDLRSPVPRVRGPRPPGAGGPAPFPNRPPPGRP